MNFKAVLTGASFKSFTICQSCIIAATFWDIALDYKINSGKDRLNPVINMLSTRKVNTLSNPGLTVMNNQPALLKVAKNEVYFRFRENTVTNNANSINVNGKSTEIKTIPVGLVMSVHCTIDPDSRK